MLKKILFGVVLVGALAALAVASILLDAGADERGIAVSSYIDTLDMMAKATDLPDQAVADAI